MKKYEFVKPAEIEKESMRIIDDELKEIGIEILEPNLSVIKRAIHTTADFDYAENLKFTEDAVQRIVSALKDKSLTIITDTNMALSGISKPALKKLNAEAYCFMADENIKDKAKKDGTTRAYASMYQGAERYPNGIFVVGNAPTALIALREMMEDGFRPSLIVGVPVGFVNVVESKDEILAACQTCDIPAIVAIGRKGGSNLAASIVNSLLYIATDMVEPAKRG